MKYSAYVSGSRERRANYEHLAKLLEHSQKDTSVPAWRRITCNVAEANVRRIAPNALQILRLNFDESLYTKVYVVQ